MQQTGFSEEKAKGIEENYHRLYVESDNWVQAKLDQVCKDGYATVAFGLRVRAPLLAKYGKTNTTGGEQRTVGNAFGQSYCLLNSRAGNETCQKVKASKYRNQIKPTMQIHDACYFLVQDVGPTPLWFLNKTLGKAMAWDGLPEIQHPEVKLSGELDVFYPNWTKDTTLKNDYTVRQVYDACRKLYKEAA